MSKSIPEQVSDLINNEGLTHKQVADQLGISRWSSVRYYNRSQTVRTQPTTEADRLAAIEARLDALETRVKGRSQRKGWSTEARQAAAARMRERWNTTFRQTVAKSSQEKKAA